MDNKKEKLPSLMIQNIPTSTEPKSISNYNSSRRMIINNSMSNAYNKHSLGSIPSSLSVLLFYDPTIQAKKGFNSQVVRFPQNRPLWKSSILENNMSTKTNPISPQQNPIKEKKSNSNGRNQLNIHYSPRFEDKDLFISKHSPGPGEYNIDNDTKDKGNNRYKSLYVLPSYRSAQKESSLGPGYYNIETLPQKKSNIYMSSVSRSDSHDYNKKDSIPGPGTYTLAPISIKKNTNPSFFFKNKDTQKIELVEKYVNTQNSLNSISPGPGSYELTSIANIPKETTKKGNIKYFSDIKREIKQNSNASELIKISTQQTENTFFDSYNNKAKKQELLKALYDPLYIPYHYYSNSTEREIHPKDKSKNHLPGPCYYNPTMPTKKKYNKNKQNYWI